MFDTLQWITWLNQLQAIAQNGLTYSNDIFDQERYAQLRQITAHMISQVSQLESQQIFNMLTNELGYATPKFGVRGVIFQENKILLVQERADEKWTLPGGWADLGYSPSIITYK